ncbi:MAG: ABC transporter ATP-binding protein [Bacteroidota bacterium]
MTNPTHPVVHAREAGVTLGGTSVLAGCTFTVPAGRLTGLIGPNGSGKTTLLRAIGGLIPYKGSLEFEGTEIRRMSPAVLARRLAFVRQRIETAFDVPVREYVGLGRLPHASWLSGLSGSDRRRIDEALEEVELTGHADQPLQTLSGGELQRAALAQALVQDTPTLLLDEPTSHLDVYYQLDLLRRVRELVEEGRTVLAVFHDLSHALKHADHVIVVHEGGVVSEGPAAEVITPAMMSDVFRVQATIADGVVRFV